MVTSEALDGVPILVLANKQDVEVSLPPPSSDTLHGVCPRRTELSRGLSWLCRALPLHGGRGGAAAPCPVPLWPWEAHATHRKLWRGDRGGVFRVVSELTPTCRLLLELAAVLALPPKPGAVWGGTQAVLGTTSQPNPQGRAVRRVGVYSILRVHLSLLPSAYNQLSEATHQAGPYWAEKL